MNLTVRSSWKGFGTLQPTNLCAQAAAIVEQEADSRFTGDAKGGFHRDDIRTQPFTEGVIARCKKELGVETHEQ